MMPARGQWWERRRGGRRVQVRRVGRDHVTFVAVRAAGAIRVTYRTALAYFVRTYRRLPGRPTA